jgi:hypothetical protein
MFSQKYFHKNNKSKILKDLETFLLKVKLKIQKISQLYPTLIKNFQLTIIYLIPFIDLLYSTLYNVYALGYFPEILRPFFSIIITIFTSPIFSIWASPEKAFLFSYIVMELIMVYDAINLSSFLKYHLILSFSLLMFQGIIVAYWDLLFNREVFIGVSHWSFDQGLIIESDPILAILFFLNIFFIFFFFYIYFYITALQGKMSKIPFMNWLTDSAAFWVRIKTPTMRQKKMKKN